MTDNGIGVPVEQRQQIFEMFSRGDGNGYRGTGVGLAVCQRVMQRRGGEITVDSAPGGGSRFSCFFPDEWDATLRVGPSLFAPSDGLGLSPSERRASRRARSSCWSRTATTTPRSSRGCWNRRALPWSGVASVTSPRPGASWPRTRPTACCSTCTSPTARDSTPSKRSARRRPTCRWWWSPRLADEAIAVEALRRGAQDYVLKGRVTADGLSRTILFAIERQSQELCMVEAALTDALTGLANRRCLADRLAAALGRAGRGEAPPAVLLLDLDGFKAVNDERGHRIGDAVLVEVANRLRGAVRGTDTVARLGGDEFVVLCEGLDAAGAAEVSERVQFALAQPILIEEDEVTLGVSIGVVVAGTGDAAADVLDRADAAMYAAKPKGR